MNPLAISGILVAVAGPLLVQYLGISDACGTEVAGKLAEYAPVIAGSVMAFVGHKKSVGSLRRQVGSLGHVPQA